MKYCLIIYLWRVLENTGARAHTHTKTREHTHIHTHTPHVTFVSCFWLEIFFNMIICWQSDALPLTRCWHNVDTLYTSDQDMSVFSDRTQADVIWRNMWITWLGILYKILVTYNVSLQIHGDGSTTWHRSDLQSALRHGLGHVTANNPRQMVPRDGFSGTWQNCCHVLTYRPRDRWRRREDNDTFTRFILL